METAKSTIIAIRKRIATKEIGGRSRNPILMASQVELQTMQSVSHATGIPHPPFGRHFFCSDTLIVFTRASIARGPRLVKAGRVDALQAVNSLTVAEPQ